MLIIKKFFAFILALLMLPGISAGAEEMQPSVSAQCAVLKCGNTLIYEKNADRAVPIASTTKLMTALVTLESCTLDESVEILPEYCGIEGSSMYLRAGTSKNVEELLQGLLLVSGNDAAVALACHISGSQELFVERMNEKAAELGMNKTHFANPHGLTEEGHFSTARDMALLMDSCMENAGFRRINAMKSCQQAGLTFINHNKLLFSCSGCVGGKTGYTEAAGRCLVSCCEREGGRLICVTLSAPDDWNDHKKLYDWGYERCSLRRLNDSVELEVSIIAGEMPACPLLCEGECSLFAPNAAEVELIPELPWYSFAPVRRGQRAGKVRVIVDGQAAGEYYLIYGENISLRN